MTSSSTYLFDPAVADVAIEAFDRIQVRGNMITAQHMISARRSMNLELQTWANRGIDLWAVDLQTVPLLASTANYLINAATVSVLDVYISQDNGDGTFTDRIMSPMSRTDYASIPNKASEGFPTQYWFNRLILPELNVWLTPNEDMTLKFWRMRRLQDAAPTMGQTLDVHYRFQDAFTSGLTARLAEKYAPDQWAAKKAVAKAAWDEAAEEDREVAPFYIRPDLSGYNR